MNTKIIKQYVKKYGAKKASLHYSIPLSTIYNITKKKNFEFILPEEKREIFPYWEITEHEKILKQAISRYIYNQDKKQDCFDYCLDRIVNWHISKILEYKGGAGQAKFRIACFSLVKDFLRQSRNSEIPYSEIDKNDSFILLEMNINFITFTAKSVNSITNEILKEYNITNQNTIEQIKNLVFEILETKKIELNSKKTNV